MENQDSVLEEDQSSINYLVEEQKVISVDKFIVLSIVSFGLYNVWWMYKAWRFFSQKDRLDIMPAARAIFSIFFLISLGDRILVYAREKGYNNNYSSVLLLIGFVIVNLMSRLPDPFWLVSIASFIFLIPPFMALNYAKRHSTELLVTEQTSYNGRQIGLIVFGVIFWLLVLLGLLIGEEYA